MIRIIIGLLISVTVYANTLKEVQYSTLNDGRTQLVLEFSSPIPKPNKFIMDNPPSVVLDFLKTNTSLGEKDLKKLVDIGVIKGFSIIPTDDKLRLIIDIVSRVPVELKSVENKMYVNLGTPTYADDNPAFAPLAINNFDFKRGDKNEAKIIIDLSSDVAIIDFKEDSQKIQALFTNTTLPDRLARKYDVTDFGTPIKSISLYAKGVDVVMEIDAPGLYDKLAYQMDKQFIVEMRELTKAEQEQKLAQQVDFTGEKLSLNFQDIDVRAVLQLLADFNGFNLITSDSVKGALTMRLQNVPWDQALDIILKSKNLDKRQIGNVMMVGLADELNNREQKELESKQQSATLAALRPEMIQMNYAKAEDLAAMIKQKDNSLLTDRGSVTFDKRTNTLLVNDVPEKIEEVKSFVKKLDTPVKQVEIATQIVKVRNEFGKDLGVRLGGAHSQKIGHRRLGIGSSINKARALAESDGTNAPNPTVDTSTISSVASSAEASEASEPTVTNTEGLFSDLLAGATVPGVLGLAVSKLPANLLLDLELRALEYENKTKTIARPRLLTMDQVKAVVETGTEIPFQQAGGLGTSTTTFKKAVISLEVTPQITPDEKIIMDLTVSNDIPGTATDAGTPIDTNKLETKILAENGETLMLGGVLQRTSNNSRSKVPFFGDIPFIKGLFRNRQDSDTQNEIVIFITPKILKTAFAA